MRKRYWLLISIALFASAAIAAGVVSIGGAAPTGNRGSYSGSAGPGFASGKLAVLSRPATAQDALPPTALGPGAANIPDITAARLSTADGAKRIFVAPGRNGTDCLIVIDAAERSAAVDCADANTLISGTIYISLPDSSTQTEDVIGIVSDGVPQVTGPEGQATSVRDNVFTLDGMSGQTVTLTNDRGATSAVDLGTQLPRHP
jgi:hypothetical protein